MQGKSHVITGIASLVAVTSGASLLANSPLPVISDVVSNLSEHMAGGVSGFGMLIYAGFYMIGVLAPDTDTETSLAGKIVHVPIPHRTWFHSVWPVLVLFILGLILWRGFSWIALGWFVHLFWDSLSRQGICWFYPHPGFVEYESGAKVKRGNHIWCYKNGQSSETLTVAASVVVAILLSIWS